jgi:hypothetical protein
VRAWNCFAFYIKKGTNIILTYTGVKFILEYFFGKWEEEEQAKADKLIARLPIDKGLEVQDVVS